MRNHYSKFINKNNKCKEEWIFEILFILILILMCIFCILQLNVSGKQEVIVKKIPILINVEEIVHVPKIVYIPKIQNLTPTDTNSLELPQASQGEFKTYMSYTTITNTMSKQWALQQLAKTDDNGFRKFNGKYIIAVGTYYAEEVGKELIIEFDTGNCIYAIVGDIKMDNHTDENNQYIPMNGNIIEFIVDIDKMDDLLLKLGDVSSNELRGKIINIEEVKYNE